MNKKISIIGAKQGWGARRSGCEDGPQKLKDSAVEESLHSCGIAAKWTDMLASHSSARGLAPELKETLPHVLNMDERLYQKVRAELRHSKFPLVIGGDHSIAVGTWSAVVDELSAHEKFGLIWVDAHMDAHTPKTCNEGAWGGYYHGQPLSALLGEGEECFVKLGDEKSPKIAPENVCLIGIRSYEPGEKAFLERHNVRVYYMEEVHKRGLKMIMQEAKKIATSGTKGYGMTIDLDGFDPEDAPGVGTNEPDGLRREEFCDAIRGMAADPQFKALEITEYNPHRGKGGKTIHLVKELLLNIF